MMATAFDLGGIFLLVIMAVSGLKKGLIDGVLKIVGMYAAMYVAMNYSYYAVLIIEPLISIPATYKTIAGYGIAFLATMYSFTILGFILKKIVRTINLGIVDRVGGITLGVTKAGLLLSAVVWAFALVPPDMRGTWQQESKLYPNVEFFADNVVKIFGMEDEMTMLQSSIGSIVSGEGVSLPELAGDDSSAGLLDGLLGGNDGNSALSPDLLKMLGGSKGEDQTEILSKAMESMGGAQKGLMQQMLKSAGVEGLGGADLDIMGEVEKIKHAGTNRQTDMDKLLDEIEAAAQSRGNVEPKVQDREEVEAEAQDLEEQEVEEQGREE